MMSQSNRQLLKIQKIFSMKNRSTFNGDHLIFLVHGYRGKALDMSHIRNTILFKYPNSRVYTWKSIQNIESDECNIFK